MRAVLSLSAVALAVPSASCGTRAPETAPSASQVFDVGTADEWPDVYKDVAREAWLYAQMSENSYGGTPHFELPPNVRLLQAYHDSLGTGFGYHIYEVRAAPSRDAVEQVVIAFRGTDGFRNGPDWTHGNLGWTQNDLAEALFDSLRRANPPRTRFVVTGHSLGGALSLQVSTRNDSVDAFVFNSSYHFRDSEDTPADRYSIAERREVLGVVRGPLRNPTIWHHPDFTCTSGGPFKRHMMPAMAWCVTKVAAFVDEAAQRSVAMNPTIRHLVEGRDLVDTLPMAADSVPEGLRPVEEDAHPLRRRRWWMFWR